MSERSSLFRKKLEEHPHNSLFRFSLAQALFEEGSLTESMNELQSCLKERPDWMIASLLLGKQGFVVSCSFSAVRLEHLLDGAIRCARTNRVGTLILVETGTSVCLVLRILVLQLLLRLLTCREHTGYLSHHQGLDVST